MTKPRDLPGFQYPAVK